MSTAFRGLYPGANLDQLKRQAKELKRSLSDGNDEALSRAREHLSQDPSSEPPTLRDAQHVLAREFGFTSWGDLLGWHDSDSSQLWRRITADRDGRVTDLRTLLETLHEAHQPLLVSTLSRAVGRRVRADIAYVDCTTYGEYVDAVSDPTCGWVFEADGFGSPACLDIGMPIAHRLLGHDVEQPCDGTGLSDEQVTTLEPIARQMLEDLRLVFEPAGSVRLRDMQFHPKSSTMEAAHKYDIIYLIGYEIGDADSTSRWSLLSLGYPIMAITELLVNAQQSDATA